LTVALLLFMRKKAKTGSDLGLCVGRMKFAAQRRPISLC
jgi:hypothetical protein